MKKTSKLTKHQQKEMLEYQMMQSFTVGAGTGAVELFGSNDLMVSYVKVKQPTELRHLRSFATHEPVMLDM